MQKKIISALILGILIGGLDLIPMIIQKLSWDASLAAFSMWIISSFFVATSNLDMRPAFKGILISFLCLTPSAILIGWQEPLSLIPITVMTLVLGALLGLLHNLVSKKLDF